ncbi:MAG: hypothetical protein HYY16_18270 [Planctomycetes bacterium]|nr:hypothetical protein [Planctomycetota bacterium]
MRILSCAFILVGAGLGQDSTTRPEEGLRVRRISGVLSVWRSAATRVEEIDAEAGVAMEDRLGTTAGSGAKFTTGALTVFLDRIRPSKDEGLGLERTGEGKLVLRLYKKGRVVLESFEPQLTVETPHGTLTADRAAYFVASVDEGQLKVVALEGPLRFRSDLGTCVVEEGEAFGVERGAKRLPKPRAATLEETGLSEGAERENLLTNPGFSDGFEDWAMKSWLPAEVDQKVFRSRPASGRMTLKGKGRNAPIFPTKRVGGLKAQARYALRFYMRTEGFTRTDGRPGKIKVCIDREGGTDWKETSLHHEFEGIEGRWVSRRLSFVALGAEAGIGIFLSEEAGEYSGSIWVDDFLLAEFPNREP